MRFSKCWAKTSLRLAVSRFPFHATFLWTQSPPRLRGLRSFLTWSSYREDPPHSLTNTRSFPKEPTSKVYLGRCVTWGEPSGSDRSAQSCPVYIHNCPFRKRPEFSSRMVFTCPQRGALNTDSMHFIPRRPNAFTVFESTHSLINRLPVATCNSYWTVTLPILFWS
jgi:hypothetical protein